ncbi:PadR family transcriptional regulator [Actinomadura sp. SCN-SB]|uniref:PadR family transcriptional regulator n=1 Tax=Actinomadura sp. SCN-SB TaxID=3373092 RepID=UPI00375360F6
MSLKFAVLAALLEGEASGYELAKRFDAGVANFWSATPQQLYRELDRLDGEGLVTARVVEQERRPNKRMFSMTEAGRAALRTFLAAPTRPDAVRGELLVKVQAVDAGDEKDVDAVIAAIEERMEWSRAKLARYDRLRARMLAGRDEDEYVRTVERVGPYLTLMRGRGHEQEHLRWSESVLTILRARTRVAETHERQLP